MFPHERSLVQKLASKPFALLGINTDTNKNDVKTKNKNESITWRSWFDGSTGGPICKQYKVSGFPTIYVLDEKGIIRAKDVRGEKMDEAVEALLKKLEEKPVGRLDLSPAWDTLGEALASNLDDDLPPARKEEAEAVIGK